MQNLFFSQSHLVFPDVGLQKIFTTPAYFPEPGLKLAKMITFKFDLSFKSKDYNVLHHFMIGFGSLTLWTLRSFGVLGDVDFLWCFSCSMLKNTIKGQIEFMQPFNFSISQIHFYITRRVRRLHVKLLSL